MPEDEPEKVNIDEPEVPRGDMPDAPNTGDRPIYPMVVLALLALGGLILPSRRKSKAE